MARKLALLIVIAAFVLSSAGLSNAAQWANPELLLTAKQLKEKVGNPDWVILDCRKLKDYAKGHVPGAPWFPTAPGIPIRSPLRSAN